MEKLEDLNLGRMPEKFKKEGVFAHNKEKVIVGDRVEAIRDVQGGIIPKGAEVVIKEIIIEPKGNERGFSKRIKVDGFEGEFNPKRFKKL